MKALGVEKKGGRIKTHPETTICLFVYDKSNNEIYIFFICPNFIVLDTFKLHGPI